MISKVQFWAEFCDRLLQDGSSYSQFSETVEWILECSVCALRLFIFDFVLSKQLILIYDSILAMVATFNHFFKSLFQNYWWEKNMKGRKGVISCCQSLYISFLNAIFFTALRASKLWTLSYDNQRGKCIVKTVKR